jgi:hypothetical protein
MSDPKSPARPAGHTVVRKAKIKRWNEKRKQTFLAKLAETANVRSSAKEVGLSKTAAYDLKQRDPVFAEAWRDALEIGFSELEMALLRRGLEGSEREERMELGKEKELKYVKTTRSFTFVGPLRLLMAHREEVMAHRQARAQPDISSMSATDRARAWLDEIRARLAGHREKTGQQNDD